MQYSKSSPHLQPLVEQRPVKDMAVLAVAKRATKLQTLANPCGAMAKRSPSSLQRERRARAHTQENPENPSPIQYTANSTTCVHLHSSIVVYVSSYSHPSLVTGTRSHPVRVLVHLLVCRM